jgi:soluble lytic murein transglycosylase-like protein
MPATARFYEKGITREGLYDPNVNLRIGFRYLRGLVKEYKGDVNLALLVYNRGPVAVERARAGGDNPSNGYDRIVTRGYRGKGTVE